MTSAFEIWQRTQVHLGRGHLKPTTGDIIEWLLGVLPLSIFILWGSWWALAIAFAWWRLLIPQWGVPEYLRWED